VKTTVIRRSKKYNVSTSLDRDCSLQWRSDQPQLQAASNSSLILRIQVWHPASVMNLSLLYHVYRFSNCAISDLLSLKQDQIPEPVVKKVEFRLLLYLACQEAPQNVIQVSNINSKLYWTGN